jgi:hypothetical protein
MLDWVQRISKKIMENSGITANPESEIASRTIQLYKKVNPQRFICSELVFFCYDQILGKHNPLNNSEYSKSPSRVPAEYYVNDKFLSPMYENGRLHFLSGRPDRPDPPQN